MNVQEFVASALFCDDIREEVGGQFTVVGIYPDNISLPAVPIVMPALSVYARVSLALHAIEEGMDLTISMSLPGAPELISNTMPASSIAQVAEDSRSQGSPVATFISRFKATPAPISAFGQIQIVVEYGSRGSLLAGFVNVVALEDNVQS